VKRTVIILTGLATLGVAAYIGSRLHAQEQPQIQPTAGTTPAPVVAPRTKMAIMNLLGVIQNYDKWKDFQRNYEGYVQQFKKEAEKIQQDGLALKSQLEKATDDATKNKCNDQLKVLQRQFQDREDQYKRELSKYQDEVVVQIYREIEDAVRVYARANDIELVMHYNEMLTPSEIHHPTNVKRKLSNPACLPIYSVAGMDVTSQITEMLNSRVRAQTQPAAPPMH
jgi:Skp family chaperone for outer membrane proteins